MRAKISLLINWMVVKKVFKMLDKMVVKKVSSRLKQTKFTLDSILTWMTRLRASILEPEELGNGKGPLKND